MPGKTRVFKFMSVLEGVMKDRGLERRELREGGVENANAESKGLLCLRRRFIPRRLASILKRWQGRDPRLDPTFA